MKALRICLHQTSANYRKGETIENRMTYPLPPLSTVIGALHGICGYTKYHEMKISIQGRFASLHKEPFVDYCFLNSTMDDRGILVKMKNETMLSNAFSRVASAKKSQGNSFLKGITIEVHDENLLEEYRELRRLGDRISEWKNTEFKKKLLEYKEKRAELASEKKQTDKNSTVYQEIVEKEKAIKREEKEYKEKTAAYENENYKVPLARFRTVVKSLRYYEILDDIDLILHVSADDGVLDEIYRNIWNLKSLGRSEDFVDIREAGIVELVQGEYDVESPYSAYLNYDDIVKEKIFTKLMRGRDFSGTKYYLGKKYEIQDGKRIFTERIKAVYTSNFAIEGTSGNVWIDCYQEEGSDKVYIVNFL